MLGESPLGEFDDFEVFLNLIVTKPINPGHVYDMIYDALIKDSSYAEYGAYPKELKIKALDSLIHWFELTEEYEKCKNVKVIKDRICS
tara:strand:- start:576 stop:839 length:264 start_codon:yes stop_codon:yes gene_type:complete